jgi:hypothetical protein
MRSLAVLLFAFSLATFAGAPDAVACDESNSNASSASAPQSEGDRVADVRPESEGKNTTDGKADKESVAQKSEPRCVGPDCD